MTVVAARATADWLTAAGAEASPIHIAAAAVRSGASAARYAACVGATTIGEYIRRHTAHDQGVGVTRKTARADLVWGLTRGDIQVPALAVRYMRSGSSDLATEITAVHLDHMLAQRGVDALDAHELHPPPGEGGPAEHGPWARDDPRIHTLAYTTGMRVLRASMAGDAAKEGSHIDDGDDQINTDWNTWPMVPAVVMSAAPKEADLIAPASVQAAKRGPEWDIPNGWRAAVVKEVSRVEGFNGWAQISGGEMRRLRRELPHQVSMGNIVAVLTLKKDPSGNPRAPEILRKLRVAISVDAGCTPPYIDSLAGIRMEPTTLN